MKISKLATAAAFSCSVLFGTAAFADDAKPDQSVGEYASDAVVTTKIKAAFVAEKDLSVLDISVETVDGVAALTGTVDSTGHAELAERVAGGVEGVKRVDNRLMIAPVKAVE